MVHGVSVSSAQHISLRVHEVPRIEDEIYRSSIVVLVLKNARLPTVSRTLTHTV